METINSRFNLSRVLTWIALAALLFTAIFKVLQLQGTSELTLLSFVMLAASLITSSVSGIYFNRDKDGAMRVAGVVSGVVLMITGYAFKILHLSGADQIIVFSTVVLSMSMLINTFHAYNRTDERQSLFTFLHEKYTPGIERFLLLLIIPIFLSKMIHVVLVFAAGLQFISLLWRNMEQNASSRSMSNLTGVIVAIICLLTPMLGGLVAMEIRLTTVVLFSIAGVFLSLRFEGSYSLASYLVFVAPAMFTLTSLAKLGFPIAFLHNVPFNVVVCSIILLGIFLSRKYSVMRTFMILSLGYLLEL